jgi:hypothetical protein
VAYAPGEAVKLGFEQILRQRQRSQATTAVGCQISERFQMLNARAFRSCQTLDSMHVTDENHT